MGIDPGLNATGYGVITTQSGRLQVITAGAIHPPARHPLARRLLYLYEALAQVIDSHQPDVAVVEALYTHRQYLTTATLMAHARGVGYLLSAQRGIRVVDYPPARVKKALTGSGAASKDQVARLVGVWLGTNDPSWSSDATDALALAITHAHLSDSHARVPGLGKTTRRPPVLTA